MTLGRKILTALASGCATRAQLVERIGGTTSARLRRCLHVLQDRALVKSAHDVHELTDKGRAWAAAGLEVTGGPSPGKAASRSANTLRAKAWRYLRLKGKASMNDLLFLVADGTEGDAEKNLRRYLRALTAAGYLAPLRSGWLLLTDRDTGPEAPAWNTATKTVTDANTGESWPIG